MELEDKLAVCRVVAQAILSDAAVSDDEMAVLDKLMDQYELSDEQRKEVRNRNLGEDPASLVRQVSKGARTGLIAEMAKAIAVDGEVAKVERRLIGQVAAVLGVTSEQVDAAIAADGQ